ncbi:MAG: hypothetical protein RR338_00910 [Clostridia bacterium]
MSKYVADKTYRMTNENDDLVISYVIHGWDKKAALLAFEETKNVDKLEIEVKQYKSKRSLEQNKLLWFLLGKMAVAVSGKKDKVSSEECYCVMLEEANVAFDYLLALPEAEPILRKSFRVIQKVGEREVKGKKLNLYRYFIGSSKYDTKEMTELIESVLDKLAELGVYDSEIETVRGEYNR